MSAYTLPIIGQWRSIGLIQIHHHYTYELMMRYVLANSDILYTKPIGEHTLVLWIQMLKSYKKIRK
jgi:hypothetical protein